MASAAVSHSSVTLGSPFAGLAYHTLPLSSTDSLRVLAGTLRECMILRGRIGAMTTSSSADSRRDDKARFALANQRQWLRVRDRATGRVVAYGFASVSRPGTYHLATPSRCTCDDAQWGHRCYHQRAAALYVEQARAERAREGVSTAA